MGAVRHFLKTNLLQRNKQQEIYKVLQLNFDINPKHVLIKKLYALQKASDTQLATMLAQQVKIDFLSDYICRFFLVNRQCLGNSWFNRRSSFSSHRFKQTLRKSS